MLEKLKTHYGLTLWLVRLLFCVTYVFGCWYDIKTSCYSATIYYGIGMTSVWLCLLVGILSAIIWLVILNVLVRMLLRALSIYGLPSNEFAVVVTFFFSFYYLLLGLFYLFALITPVILVWGQILFPVVSTLIASMLFFFAIRKLYLNTTTSPRMFKYVLVFSLVLCGLQILFTLIGGIAI